MRKRLSNRFSQMYKPIGIGLLAAACLFAPANVAEVRASGMEYTQLAPLLAPTVSLGELQSALDAALPGDILSVETGTFSDKKITLTYNGPGPVTIRASEEGKVVFAGNSTVTIKNSNNFIFTGFLFDRIASDNSLVLDGSSNVELKNNYFYQNGNSPTSKIVGIRNGSAHNKIHHNTFDRRKGQSIALYNGHTPEDIYNLHNDIYNNLFYRIPRVSDVYPGKSNGLEAVQFGQGKDVHNVFHTKVHDNLFELVTGDGAEIVSIKSSGNELYRNTFRNNDSGLTFRLGDSNRVYENYFENTSKGIRAFGYDQPIERNYLTGGSYGIQFPAADALNGEATSLAAPYYQSEKSRITGNVIVNPALNGMLFGAEYKADGRKLLPIDNDIRDNRIYISNLAKDYVKDTSVASFYDPIADFEGNVSHLRSTANLGNITSEDGSVIAYVLTDNPSPPTAESIIGAAPFSSRDARTGADWRRPEEPAPPSPVKLSFDFESFVPGSYLDLKIRPSAQETWSGSDFFVTARSNIKTARLAPARPKRLKSIHGTVL